MSNFKYSSRRTALSYLGLISKRQEKYLVLILFLLFLLFGCSNLIEIDPPYNTINKDNVFNNDETAIPVLNNIYTKLSESNFSLAGSISNLYLFGGLAADELSLFATENSGLSMFYYNALNENADLGFWNSTYSLIFAANSAIEGLNSSEKLTNSVKQQLLGEAKFSRAFCYFYLVNLFGKVPLVLSTDPLKNSVLPRADTEIVYQQVMSDLKDAQNLLSDRFLAGNLKNYSSERVRPTKWAAKALLSRVYLYHKDYLMAALTASQVIDSCEGLFKLDSLNNVFLKNSFESIWQLQNVHNTQGNTGEGNYFILPTNGPNTSNYPVYLSYFLLHKFELGDKRKDNWVDSVVVDISQVYYYAYKYKSGALTPDGVTTEYQTVFRLGEQYLIRAEAWAQLLEYKKSQFDLNVIRSRAGLSNTDALTKDDLLGAVLQERQVELFTEWGHRWLDLKRTGNIDVVMRQVTEEKGGTWNANWAYWPLPLADLMADPALVQNAGY